MWGRSVNESGRSGDAVTHGGFFSQPPESCNKQGAAKARNRELFTVSVHLPATTVSSTVLQFGLVRTRMTSCLG